MNRRFRKRLIKIFVTTFIFLTFIIGALLSFMLIFYPNRDKVLIGIEQGNPEGISYSASLQILSRISPLENSEPQLSEGSQPLAVEHISPEILAKYRNSGSTTSNVESYNTELVVKSANIKGKVFDGEDAHTMDKGLWHFPLSIGAGEHGNFIIIGHRFDKIPPATDTFFNLDKIKAGDKIHVYQGRKIAYTYTVTSSKTVDKNDRSVLMNYNDSRITLITCAPLWKSDKRLVVTGILDKAYRKI